VKDLEPLWKIEDELTALVDSVDTCPAELQPELEQRIAQYLAGEAAKVDRIDGVLSSLEAVQANAKTEIERLRVRAQSAEKAAKRLEDYVLHILRRRDGKPLRGRNVTLSVRHSEALIIDDPQLAPEQWKKLTVSVDIPKIPIREAIKSGTIVPGAHLEQHENLVRK
jgi:hypothetical protein